jgi:hypothetical protein
MDFSGAERIGRAVRPMRQQSGRGKNDDLAVAQLSRCSRRAQAE